MIDFLFGYSFTQISMYKIIEIVHTIGLHAKSKTKKLRILLKAMGYNWDNLLEMVLRHAVDEHLEPEAFEG